MDTSMGKPDEPDLSDRPSPRKRQPVQKPSLRERLWRQIRYGGLTPGLYDQVLPRSLAYCCEDVRAVGALIGAVGIFYVSLSLMQLSDTARLLVPYSDAVAGGIVALALNPAVRNASNGAKFTYVYLCSALAIMHAMLIGTAYAVSSFPAIMFNVMLVAYAFIVVDIPLRFDLFAIGNLALFWVMAVRFKDPGTTLTVDLGDAVACTVIAIYINWYHTERAFDLYLQQLTVEHERDTDSLTNLRSKGSVQITVERMLSEGMQGTLVIMDLDHFKELNDTYGHLFGDEVLAYMGRTLHQSSRGNDVCGRFGGDEFLLFLPDANAQSTLAVIDRLRANLRAGSSELSHPVDDVRLSAGIAQSWEGCTYKELLGEADKALYAAKQGGRNQSVLR